MTGLDEIMRRLAALERKLNSVVRVGLVDTVDRAKCRVTVTFPSEGYTDATGFHAMKSFGLPVMVQSSLGSRDYWMPAIGDQVTCVFLPGDLATGFVLGSFYADEEPIPEGAEAEGMRMVEFADGARFEYNTAESKLRIVVGDLEIELTPDSLLLGGPGATQPFVRGTDLKSWLGAHVHPTGVGPSGPPSTAGTLDATLSTIIKGR